MILNRTLSYLILVLATAIAGSVLVYNFYQAKVENYELNKQSILYTPHQVLEAAK